MFFHDTMGENLKLSDSEDFSLYRLMHLVVVGAAAQLLKHKQDVANLFHIHWSNASFELCAFKSKP